ncbi:MAG: alpha/beta hydrolase [Planctomycetes bacterium]|nr:alpha/beta hydrolase [Planctomycetota bacterium]
MTHWHTDGFRPGGTWRNGLWRVGVSALLLSVMGTAVHAAPPAGPKTGPSGTHDDGPAEPMVVPLQTRDGVQLKCTFYPSTKGKKAVPVVILHEWKGKRSDYKDLALFLQSKGHAVMVPDLRGHGESTTMRIGPDKTITLKAIKIKKKDIELMVLEDMEAVKRFLRDEKNNEGELNLEKLCIIGVEMGAVVAANWALLDWDTPVFPPPHKRGQDVKALVLVSPEWSFKGVSMAPAIENAKLQANLSIMLMVGSKDTKALEAAEKIENKLARFHPEPADGEAKSKKTLYMVKLDTSLQGAKLVNQVELKTDRIISGFIDLRLVEQSFPWSERRRP